MREHWHVIRHNDDDDHYVTMDIYRALDYAQDELRETGEFYWEGITALGEQKMYEEAFKNFQLWQTFDNLRSNVKNVVKQHNSEVKDRAPLYSDPDVIHDYAESSPLFKTALWVIDNVNRDTAMNIYSCTGDDVIADEDGKWHESYSPSGS